MSAPIRVLLVDDQPLLLSGFAMILSTEEGIEVVGQVGNGREAVDAVGELRPDVVLMDVQMPVLDGIEATRLIVPDSEAKVVILTTFDRDDYLFDALRAGASGFLLKNADPEDLVGAIRTVAGGHGLLAPEVTQRVIARMTDDAAGGGDRGPTADGGAGGAEGPAAGEGAPRPAASGNPELLAKAELLTEREREVLGMLARGLSNGEIAADLFLGEATVKTHVSNILSKLHLRDRVQAVVFAYEAGLAQPSD